VSELTGLTVADCANGWFVIREGKTDAAARRIPINRELTPTITRRMAGQVARDHVFGAPGKGPGHSISGLFITYHRKMGSAVMRGVPPRTCTVLGGGSLPRLAPRKI
jgi:hypothetical protein